jgi:hypothetical protein
LFCLLPDVSAGNSTWRLESTGIYGPYAANGLSCVDENITKKYVHNKNLVTVVIENIYNRFSGERVFPSDPPSHLEEGHL